MAQNFLSDIKFGDNIYIRLGDGTNGDLRLYHNATHSYIDGANTGDLYIRSLSDDVVIQGADDVFIYTQGGEDAIIARGDAGVELFYNTSKKIETTNAGATVTGDATVTGNVGMATGNATGKFAVMSSAVHGSYDFYNNGTSYFNGDVTIDANITQTTGTAATFAGNIRTGGTTITAASNFDNIVIEGTSHTGINIISGSTGTDSDGGIYFGDQAANNLGQIKYVHSSNSMTFITNDGNPSLTLDSGLNATFAGDVTVQGGDILNASGHFTVTSADDFNVDAAGQINLDADGGNIRFKDGGTTFGKITHASSNFFIQNPISDGDFYIQGNDGGSTINMLYFDTSDSGKATFAGDVGLGGTGLYTNTASLNIDGTGLAIKNDTAGSSNNWSIIKNTATASTANLVFVTGLGTSLTLNHDMSATFAGNVTVQGATTRLENIVTVGNSSADYLQVRYNDTADYATMIKYHGIQLGNNGANDIIAGKTAANGYLRFYTNNTNDGLTNAPNGTLALTLAASGVATFEKSITMNTGSFTVNSDTGKIYLGADDDMHVYHTGSHGYVLNKTGALYIMSQVQDGNVVFSADNGEANATQADYFYLDGGSATHNGSITTAMYTIWKDYSRAAFGNGKDLQIFHDGSHSYIQDTGTGHLMITGSQVQINSSDNSENMATFAENGSVNLYNNGVLQAGTMSDGWQVPATKGVYFDGGAHTYIKEVSADRLGVYSGGRLMLDIYEDGDSSSYIDMHAPTVSIHSAESQDPLFQIKNTNADANAPRLALIKDSASPADNDETGRIYMYGDNDAGEQIESVLIRGIMTDVSDGSEDSTLEMFTYKAGTQTSTLALASGNVGIGHTTPQFGLTIAQGSGDINKIGWEDSSNHKRASILCNSGNDNLEFRTGTSENIGLHITASQVSYFHNSVYFSSSGVGLISWGSMGGGTGFGIRGESGRALSLGAGGSWDHVIIDTSGNATFGGNVGIGGAPSYELDVNKSEAGGVVDTRVYNSDTSNTSSGARLISAVGGAGSGDPRLVLAVTGVAEYNIGIDNSDSDKFKINSGSDPSAGTNYLTIHNGNVGIGDSAPNTKLEVNGDVTIRREGSETAGELLLGGTTDGGFIDFDGTNLQLNTQRDPNTGTFVNTSKSQAGITLTGANADSNIKFYTTASNNGTATLRWTIDKNGALIKNGGTSSQFLMADGSVSTSSFNGGTVTNDITIDKDAARLILQDDSTGNALNQWVSYRDNDGTERAYVGYGSTGNSTFYVVNHLSDLMFYAGGVLNETKSGTASTFAGNIFARRGSFGTASNFSFDLYNNGTSYFNGAVTVDDTFTQTTGTTATFSGTVICNNVGSDKKIRFNRTSGNTFSIEHDTSRMYFYNETTSAVMLSILNGGNVGIGTVDADSDGYSYAEDLVIKGGASASDGAGITIAGNGKRYGVIAFGDAADNNIGEIYYDHTNNDMNFRTNTTVGLTIHSNQVATFAGYLHLNGIVNATGTGGEIGRNHAYDTLELKGYGAELMIGGQHTTLHINYRTCNNGTSNHTPTDWYWRAGTSSNWSNHNFGNIAANGTLTSTGDATIGGNVSLTGNSSITAGGYLHLITAGGGNMYTDLGGIFYIRDIDSGNADRFTLNSANGDCVIGGDLHVDNNSSVSINTNSTNYLQINNAGDTLRLAGMGGAWCHIMTSADRFYFDKPLWVDTGNIGSYNEDVQHHRAGTNYARGFANGIFQPHYLGGYDGVEGGSTGRRIVTKGSGDNSIYFGCYDDNGYGYLENYNNSSGMYFNTAAGHFRFDTGSVIPYNDSEIYLGLDANRWICVYADGFNTSGQIDFTNGFSIKQGSSNYGRIDNWVDMQSTGFYSSTLNGAHIYPNNYSSYGSMALSGTKNNYYGMLFANIANKPHIMYDASGNGGDYHEGNGTWAYYWHVSNACMGVGNSTTSSSYTIYANGAIYSTADIVAYSDKRAKENIVTVDNALDKVSNLRGVYYNKKDSDEKKREVGVIAQEVKEVLPEVVTYDKENDQYGVDYGKINGLLIEAIKDLKKEIEELKQCKKCTDCDCNN